MTNIVPAQGGGAGTVAVEEDGSSVVAAATIFDFKDLNVESDGGGQAGVYLNDHAKPAGRLTLATATPVTIADQSAKTTLYWTPYRGDQVALFDGTRWMKRAFAEVTIQTTVTESCTLVNGSAVVAAVAAAKQLIPGMKVSGTGIPVGATILSVDSATQITLSANATADGASDLTFKVPAGKNLDVFLCYLSSDTQGLRFSNTWTNDTTRADALVMLNGVLVNNALIDIGADAMGIPAQRGLYVGTIRTTSTDGEMEDSIGRRFVWNYYNQTPRKLYKVMPSNNTYETVAWQVFGGAATNIIAAVIGVAEQAVPVTIKSSLSNTDTVLADAYHGIGADYTSGGSPFTDGTAFVLNKGQPAGWTYTAASENVVIFTPAAGYRFWSFQQYGHTGGDSTWNAAGCVLQGTVIG